jgi:hypothetical protein
MKTFSFLLGILSIYVTIWSLSTLYSWFLVPLGLPNLSLIQVFGIYCFWKFLNYKPNPSRFDKNKKEITPEMIDNAITENLTSIIVKLIIVGLWYCYLNF